MIIDDILDRIENNRIRKIEPKLLEYIIANTSTCEEVKFVVNRLESMGVRFRENDYILILNFIDDYEYTKNVFEKIKIHKIEHKLKKPVSIFIYNMLLQTTDTFSEVEYVISELKKDYKDIPPVIYMTLVEKQNDYQSALKIFNEHILSLETMKSRIKGLADVKWNDSMSTIYGSLYLKANDKEQQEFKKELERIKMSTNLEDYNYLKIKKSKRRVLESRELIKKDIDSEYTKYAISTFFDKERNSSITKKFSNNTKVKRISNLYQRNRDLVEKVKKLHDNRCQICGQRLNLGNKLYSEVHHIQPLHLNGPDIIENMIVVCPNHHILFDRGAIALNITKFNKAVVKYVDGNEEKIEFSSEHRISEKFINFHNRNIFMSMENDYLSNISKNYNVSLGSNIIITNTETKEEVRINIKNDTNDLTFLEFQLLGKKLGECINIDNYGYLISQIR